MHRSFSKEPPPPPSIYPSGSKSTKDFVWRASPFLPPRKAYSRLFVSSHRVLTLRDGRCRGDNISTIGWYMPRRSEWLCRRKTCLIKYRAICHGSLWCDRERIILWISSSATCSPSASPPPLFLIAYELLTPPFAPLSVLRADYSWPVAIARSPSLPSRSSHVFFVSLVSTIADPTNYSYHPRTLLPRPSNLLETSSVSFGASQREGEHRESGRRSLVVLFRYFNWKNFSTRSSRKKI